MTAEQLDILQKIGLIPAIIIAIVVIYRDSKASSAALFAQQAARIDDLTSQIKVLNQRIDTLLTNQIPPGPVNKN